MKELTTQQLKAIEKLSATIISTRSELAEALCEALGEEFTWSKGFVNGHGNSIVLWCGNTLVDYATYQYKDPKSVSVKLLSYGDYTYVFDYYGKVKAATKRRAKETFENGMKCISYEYEQII